MTMTRGESPAPARQPGLPGDQRCESAREEIASLLASGHGLGQLPHLREHLIACSDCNAVYRSSLLAETRLRRALLDTELNLDDEQQPPARAVLSPLHVARAGFSSSGKGKAAWVIALAVVFYTLVRLTPEPAGAIRARLRSLAGEVSANGVSLIAGSPERELERGDWVRTSAGARARLEFGATRVDLAPSTQVQIEEPAEHRLRLEAGSLEVRGSLLLSSPFGIVEIIEGGANLWVDAHGLMVRSTAGELRAIDARGEHALQAGEDFRLALAR